MELDWQYILNASLAALLAGVTLDLIKKLIRRLNNRDRDHKAR